MERLFIYGTLQDRSVQLRVFGRIAHCIPAQLPGFRKCRVGIGAIYPIAIPDERERASIPGHRIEVTYEELERIDQYEGKAYIRSRVQLADGNSAWVYRNNPDWISSKIICAEDSPG